MSDEGKKETGNVPAETPEASPPAVAGEGPRYLDDDELTTPRIKIDHDTGKFVNNLTEEEFEELNCVLLDVRLSRVRWDKNLDNQEPLCRSNDRVKGEGNPGGECAKCSLQEWTNGDKPECAETHTYLGLDEAGAPFFFTVSRTGIPPSRRYLSGAQYRRKPIYATWTVLTLKAQKKGGNTYYVPVFKRGESVAEELLPEMNEAMRQLGAVWERYQARREETEGAGGADF
ncbi:MAG: hypothetical protein PVH29_06095 [Candidatus Zixiibacteriota bacterium]|jgi:hypothetical protein